MRQKAFGLDAATAQNPKSSGAWIVDDERESRFFISTTLLGRREMANPSFAIRPLI